MSNFWRNLIKLAIEGILGGLMISIGAIVLLSCSNKIVGAILFSIGLLTINRFGLGLYTGKVGMIRNGTQLWQTLFILVTNFVGCLIMLVFPMVGAKDMVISKLSASHLEWFVKGVVCGVLIYICVANKDVPLYTIFAVPSFILCGAEHSIADIAILLSAREFSWKGVIFIVIVALGNAVGALAFSLLLDVKNKLATSKK